MGLSRAYLGAHSFNQIIFGALLGVTFAVIGHNWIKPLFLNLPEHVMGIQHGRRTYFVGCSRYLLTIFFGLFFPWFVSLFVLSFKSDRAFYHTVEYR